ncbi:MAG: hypothetical protein U0744_19595 [Gemmataceae bacterium]
MAERSYSRTLQPTRATPDTLVKLQKLALDANAPRTVRLHARWTCMSGRLMMHSISKNWRGCRGDDHAAGVRYLESRRGFRRHRGGSRRPGWMHRPMCSCR